MAFPDMFSHGEYSPQHKPTLAELTSPAGVDGIALKEPP